MAIQEFKSIAQAFFMIVLNFLIEHMLVDQPESFYLRLVCDLRI